MQSPAARSCAPLASAGQGRLARVAFVGAASWLEDHAPSAPSAGLQPAAFPAGRAGELDRERLQAFDPSVTVVFDPEKALESKSAEPLPGISLGVVVDDSGLNDPWDTLASLDRLVCFDPRLTGRTHGGTTVWRAVPIPVSDALFAPARTLHREPAAMSIGATSAHREAMLLPAKHRFDLLELLHGVSGGELHELLCEYDVGVHVAREHGGGFGPSVPLHLAAGQLLLSEALVPAHGLEEGIDYLQVQSPEQIVTTLERLTRFPEMYHGVRVRGRLKAEQYRASRLFARLIVDLLADVRAFGRAAPVDVN